jgi:hypothetical protein
VFVSPDLIGHRAQEWQAGYDADPTFRDIGVSWRHKDDL